MRNTLELTVVKVAIISLSLAGAALPAGAALGPDQSQVGHVAEAPDVFGQPLSFTGKRIESLVEPMIELAFSEGTTNTIVNRLNGGVAECGALPAEYRADCMAQTYRSAASQANPPDYATARTQLNQVSRNLSALVSQNADAAAQPIRKGAKTFRAVKKSAARAVNAKAAAIISEAETKLLRAANSGLRKVHYQRIAQAVGSTKAIFRS